MTEVHDLEPDTGSHDDEYEPDRSVRSERGSDADADPARALEHGARRHPSAAATALVQGEVEIPAEGAVSELAGIDSLTEAAARRRWPRTVGKSDHDAWEHPRPPSRGESTLRPDQRLSNVLIKDTPHAGEPRGRWIGSHIRTGDRTMKTPPWKTAGAALLLSIHQMLASCSPAAESDPLAARRLGVSSSGSPRVQW